MTNPSNQLDYRAATQSELRKLYDEHEIEVKLLSCIETQEPCSQGLMHDIFCCRQVLCTYRVCETGEFLAELKKYIDVKNGKQAHGSPIIVRLRIGNVVYQSNGCS